jgi:hypothetical protein
VPGRVAVVARDWLGYDRTAASTGSFLNVAGAAAWTAGSLFLLGGHRAVGLMATNVNPIQTTNSISFTIDTTSEAFSLAAFTLLAAGMLAFARAAANTARYAAPGPPTRTSSPSSCSSPPGPTPPATATSPTCCC